MNGDFEVNTALPCDYNMVNAVFTTKMANAVAYGGGNELDIMQSTCPYGPSQSGIWFIGVACPGGLSDAFTMGLSAPLVAGTTYTMRFYDKGDIVCCPPGMPVVIGVSTVPGTMGTVVYTGPTPTGGVWNMRCFSFVAPNNGQNISVSSAGPTRWTHVDNFSMGGTCAILPIELVNFETQCEKNSVILNWTTATEKNNDYFIVERSENGTAFTTIGKIKGAGDSYQTLNYSFTDNNPVRGVSYYRLRQQDFEGASTYSSIIFSDNCKTKMGVSYQVFPNPVNDFLNVIIRNASASCQVTISNCVGEIISEKVLENAENVLDVSKLSSGIYLIKINGEDGLFTQKFIKN